MIKIMYNCCDKPIMTSVNKKLSEPKLLLLLILGFFAGLTGCAESSTSIGDLLDDESKSDSSSSSNSMSPRFGAPGARNVTTLVGRAARLHCTIHDLGDKTVSWLRHDGIHLLTADTQTYTSDQRFVALHNPRTEDWILQIKYPTKEDSGIYECQVSTTPPMGMSMYLSVVEPITTVLGEPEVFINRGSTMNLTCLVQHSPEPPPIIHWTHGTEEIDYDSPRGGVTVITEKGDHTTSYLLIQRAQPADSGQYTCNPSNANPQTILVHVLNGEYPAAMQNHAHCSLRIACSIYFVTGILLFSMAGNQIFFNTRA